MASPAPDELTLSEAPPRVYPLRQAYRRRIWRSPFGALCREIALLGTLGAVGGFLYGEAAWTLLGAMALALAFIALQLVTLVAHLKRVEIIRGGEVVEGWVERSKRVLLLHEFFKGDAARTFVLTYAWRTRGGAERRGRLWICGCARRAFPPDSALRILTLGARSLPFKAATLRMKR